MLVEQYLTWSSSSKTATLKILSVMCKVNYFYENCQKFCGADKIKIVQYLWTNAVFEVNNNTHLINEMH